MMSRGRKSQVTIFIILAIVLLAGVGIYFYARTIRSPIEPETNLVQQQVPLEFDPIKKYTNDCIYSVASDGLKLIGKQGGYVSLTNKSLNSASFSMTNNPTETEVISFTENSQIKIPYWWHLKSSNTCSGNCQFSSKRPDLRQSENSIEKQLERYIKAQLKTCLDNFRPFEEQGFEITGGDAITDVTIASSDVIVSVEYPITAQFGDSKTELSRFFVRIPLNLERMYNFASVITNYEIKHHYLEKHVLNLIVGFSGVDKNKLPPMSDLQFKFGSSVNWQKTSVKNRITELLDSYVQLFQVDGTANFERNIFEDELQQRLYDSTIIPIRNESYSNFGAYFTYLDFWPIYFNLNCKGERCAPSSANSIIPLSSFGIQSYKFSYDLSYPVLVEIHDADAFNGQGYNFQFFLEGNIRNNNHMPGNFSTLEIASSSERSQLCDIKNSAKVEVNVIDAATKAPIDDAQVFYTLISESCFISSTAQGRMESQFPMGVGGVVTVIKDGYISKSIEFDANIDSPSTLQIELSQISAKKLILKKKNVEKSPSGWQFNDNAIDLSEKESAIVSLSRIGFENDHEFSSISTHEAGQTEPSEIELAPGKYSAEITLLANERIVIPEKQKCEGGVLGIGEECFTIPKVDLGEGATPGEERFSPGGLKLNITITPDDLQKSTLTLYVINIDIAGIPESARIIEDLDQLAKIEEYSANYSQKLQPAFT